MPHVARKRMRCAGRVYAAGALVPLDDFSPTLQRRLVDQRKVLYEEHVAPVETEAPVKQKILAKPRSQPWVR